MKKMTSVLIGVLVAGICGAAAANAEGAATAPQTSKVAPASKAHKRTFCASGASKSVAVVRETGCKNQEVDLGRSAVLAICAAKAEPLRVRLGACPDEEIKLGSLVANADGQDEFSCDFRDRICNCYGDDDCGKLVSSGKCGGALNCDPHNPKACHCSI
ncbi:hypothetical protein [Paraliomyxa miuraensis]|uniref:hypothetical protein n=1 Tax=Paraliomyxa miuraensis TaxID=376150 RepID=UPI00224D2EE2|nr:hypothetical protein [Paraliomyxa miuraensis]MCX4239191.1 hypothetical protein [Paraliomyxa miuraensis]